jgi:hypothetical protein
VDPLVQLLEDELGDNPAFSTGKGSGGKQQQPLRQSQGSGRQQQQQPLRQSQGSRRQSQSSGRQQQQQPRQPAREEQAKKFVNYKSQQVEDALSSSEAFSSHKKDDPKKKKKGMKLFKK